MYLYLMRYKLLVLSMSYFGPMTAVLAASKVATKPLQLESSGGRLSPLRSELAPSNVGAGCRAAAAREPHVGGCTGAGVQSVSVSAPAAAA